jgi:hypothetical protein
MDAVADKLEVHMTAPDLMDEKSRRELDIYRMMADLIVRSPGTSDEPPRRCPATGGRPAKRLGESGPVERWDTV